MNLTTWKPFHFASNRLTLGQPLPPGDDVLIDADLFAEWDGPVFVDGSMAYNVDGTYMTLRPGQFFLADRWPATIADIRRTVFAAAIDANPETRFYVPVRDAGRVRELWPKAFTLTNPVGVQDGKEVIPNVTLLHPVVKQADLGGIDGFLALADLGELGLLVSPVEALDLEDTLCYGEIHHDGIRREFGSIVLHGGDRSLYDGLRRQADSAGISILETEGT
jgi:hypothetical protein